MVKQLHAFVLDNRHSKLIAELIINIQRDEFNIPITLQDQPDLLDIESFYSGSGGGFWGVFHDQELVGTIALISLGHNAGAIRKMFVKKDYRGKELNIAKILLESLLKHCRNNNINEIYLGTIDVLQAAQKFYERNGFVKIEKQNLPDFFPRMTLDSIFYHLKTK